MVNVGIELKIDPKVLDKLNAEHEMLWVAEHYDGSDNRFNGQAVADVSSFGLNTAAAVTAGVLGARKRYRDRGKTKEELAAEKKPERSMTPVRHSGLCFWSISVRHRKGCWMKER